MSNSSSISRDIIRPDTGLVNHYLYAEQPKLNFLQKLGRTMGKIGSTALKFAAPFMSLIPGFGIPLAAASYGVGNIVGDVTSNALSKDADAMKQYNASVSGKPVTLPGLFEQAAQSDIVTDFMVPSELTAPTAHTLMTREIATSNMVQSYPGNTE